VPGWQGIDRVCKPFGAMGVPLITSAGFSPRGPLGVDRYPLALNGQDVANDGLNVHDCGLINGNTLFRQLGNHLLGSRFAACEKCLIVEEFSNDLSSSRRPPCCLTCIWERGDRRDTDRDFHGASEDGANPPSDRDQRAAHAVGQIDRKTRSILGGCSLLLAKRVSCLALTRLATILLG
jgi:hypothetical protein